MGPFKPMFWFSAKKTAVGRKCFLTESCQGTDIKGTDPIQTGVLSPSFLPGALEGSILGPQGHGRLFSHLHSENTGFSRSNGAPAPSHPPLARTRASQVFGQSSLPPESQAKSGFQPNPTAESRHGHTIEAISGCLPARVCIPGGPKCPPSP